MFLFFIIDLLKSVLIFMTPNGSKWFTKKVNINLKMNFPAASCGELNPAEFATSTPHLLKFV